MFTNKYIKQNFTLLWIILLILVILLMCLINKICNSDTSLNYYIYDSNKSGNTIAIIGGTHGNEPIGSIVIRDLIDKLNKKEIILKSGKLILIPDVNYCALRTGIRMIPGIGDLNRKYPKVIHENSKCPITNKILNVIHNADFVLDFHEGWGFHRLNKKSMGTSITPTDTKLSNELANYLYNKINLTITEPTKKFIIFVNDNRYIKNPHKYSQLNDIKGSLRYFQNINKKNYILIEITGQNNVQTLDIRMSQATLLLNSTLTYFNII
jgi:hypothetical protein